ncbi:hypothetical protein BKA93DRAFT_818784 [Sparassis latifolia]
MPSLFSRARTISTPKKSDAAAAFDEFGRINSRGSARTLIVSSTKHKKSKKVASPEPETQECEVPDGSFLPLNLDPPRFEAGEEPGRQSNDYGYLSYGRHVVLGLEEVARLVDVVGNELGTRGLTTPFIFSTLALDVSSSAVKRPIQAFLRTCSKPGVESERQWRDEARFAGPHELGMCLRWGLARVVRIVKGQEVRGLLGLQSYVDWRDAETALNYPEAHFAEFLAPLEPILQSLLVNLLSLLTRFTAHSASSGHTPPTLSPLFGPLLFGLGPSTLAFHHVYMYYLRATTATEHLMLSFIRWQDVSGTGSGSGSSTLALGVPTRLKAWIHGYPGMLPSISKHDRPQPRRGARTVRVLSVRRNVRMYSPDLVKSAASWGHRPRGPTSIAGERALVNSKDWERIAPSSLKLQPRYSDAYRKRMDLPSTFYPDTGGSSPASTNTVPSLASSVSTTSSVTSSLFDDQEHSIGKASEDRFRSLTDLKWGEFEVMGFGDLGADEKKLQFDLTEGARASRAAKRATLTWQDFSSSGFTRSDAPLNATLQFSPPVTNTVNSWPSHSAEISRKLKKTQKSLPAFGWDTEPVMGSEEVIEEAFLDVFCDLVYGGGWMDAERWEEIHRECNWALVEFKSLPVTRTTTSGTADPRTSTTLILFEEFVPWEYQQQLAASGTNRRRLPSLFGNTSKSKQWKPAATLNGRPYVIGHVPNSPSYREVEFEGMLRSNGSTTKIISLARSPSKEFQRETRSPGPAASTVATPGHSEALLTVAPEKWLNPVPRIQARTDSPTLRILTRQEAVASPSPSTKRRFRLPVSPGGSRRSGVPPAEYENVDFDTRLASFDEDDLGSGKHSKRQSKDDAWVDILVANNSRRVAGQDVDLRNGHGLKGGRSDPELASQEVSEVLASVREHLSADDNDDADMEPVESLCGDAEHGEDTTTLGESVVSREQARESALYGGDDEEDEDEDEEEAHVPVFRKKLGYFDLHPERRATRNDDDDPRDRFERPSLESEELHNDVPIVVEPPTPVHPVHPVHPKLDGTSSSSSYSKSSYSKSSYSTDDRTKAEFTPSTSSMQSNADTSPLRDAAANLSSLGRRSPLPLSDDNRAGPSSIKPLPTPSKTASLIELYRERERSAISSPAPIPASRLPVRTTASLQAQSSPTERSPSPSGHVPVPPLAISPAAGTSASVAMLSETEESDVDAESLPSDREPNLPNRYVHGAPLHNVTEEEEEGEEGEEE